jgi:hypothetical protein
VSEILHHTRAAELDPVKRLGEIFREFRLKTPADIQALTSKRRSEIDSIVFAWFAGDREPIISNLRQLDRLNLCFPWLERYRSYKHHSGKGTAVKKSLMLSNSSVVTVPAFRHPGVRAWAIPTSWYLLVLEFWPLVSSGLLRILPESMTNLLDHGGIEGPRDTFREGRGFIIRRPGQLIESTWLLLEEHIPTLKNISSANAELKRQMHEINPRQRLGDGELYIYLPHLTEIAPDTLGQLRSDYGDVFGLYNATIRRLFEDSAKADNERKLLDTLCRTDEEIRRIETEFRKLSRLGALEATGAVVKLALGVLCAYLPDAYLASQWKQIAAFLAGSGALNDIRSYISTRSTKAGVAKQDAFYFPWLVHQKTARGGEYSGREWRVAKDLRVWRSA